MSGIARAIVVGNLTRDPESIVDGKGCRLGVAVNQRIKKGDEWDDYASFFDVTVWGKPADACVKYLSKGSQVAVDGELRQERWEKDGQKRSAVRITAHTVQFLSSRDDGSGGSGGDAGGGGSAGDDSDIPF